MKRNPLVAVLVGLVLALSGLAGAAVPASASTTRFDRVRSLPAGASSIISVAPGQVWVSGSDGAGHLVLDHYGASGWTRSSIDGVTGGTLTGSGPKDIWLNSGSILHHFDGRTWEPVELPVFPENVFNPSLGPVVDVPGPDFYAGFSYFADGGMSLSYAKWDGATWTFIGAPADDDRYNWETPQKLAYVDGTLVALASTYRGMNQYVFTYRDGSWSTPVQTGRYFCCSFNQWTNDWVVDAANDIWLYGTYEDETTPTRAWCAHFDGDGLEDRTCAAGTSQSINTVTRLNGSIHLAGSDRFEILSQSGSDVTRIAAYGVINVSQVAAEPQTGIVWALATQTGVPGTAILRYGVAADTATFVVTATATAQVERGEVATISGTIDPAPKAATDRTVKLQVKSGSAWKTVTSKRANATGAYRFDVEQGKVGTFDYRVTKAATGDVKGSSSPVVTVRVVKPFAVSITASKQVKIGKKAVVKGTVTPTVPDPGGRTVELQALRSSVWTTVLTGTTKASGSYRFEITMTKKGTTKYRVFKTASIRKAAASKTAKIKVVD